MKTATETTQVQKSTPTRQASIHNPACLYPDKTIEKHIISCSINAKPNPAPNTSLSLIFSLIQNEPMVRPMIEFRRTPIIRRSVAAVNKPSKLTQITPIDTLKTKIKV